MPRRFEVKSKIHELAKSLNYHEFEEHLNQNLDLIDLEFVSICFLDNLLILLILITFIRII